MDVLTSLFATRCPFCLANENLTSLACEICSIQMVKLDLDNSEKTVLKVNDVDVKYMSEYTGWFSDLIAMQKSNPNPNVIKWLTQCLLKTIPNDWKHKSWTWVPSRAIKPNLLVESMVVSLQNAGITFDESILLQRKNFTLRSQKSKSREDRIQNADDYNAVMRSAIHPSEVILFDDILTTGNTLKQCVQAVEDTYPIKVAGICVLAYTPLK